MLGCLLGAILLAAGAFLFIKTYHNDDAIIKTAAFLCICAGLMFLIGGCVKDPPSGASSNEKIYNSDGADKTIMSLISDEKV